MNHLVRVGSMAQIGRFRSTDSLRYRRGDRVVLRTARGLELGEVLSVEENTTQEPDGTLLRGMTTADELLATRLDKNRHEAFQACSGLLAEQAIDALLIDVEHLFDGRGLYFYFLGPTDHRVEALTAQLAEAYNAEARFEQFADTLEAGCGPGCGTEEGAGCGDACGSCAIAKACSTKPQATANKTDTLAKQG